MLKLNVLCAYWCSGSIIIKLTFIHFAITCVYPDNHIPYFGFNIDLSQYLEVGVGLAEPTNACLLAMA